MAFVTIGRSSMAALPSTPSRHPRRNRIDSAAEARQVRFVRPELVAEVDVRAWTADGLLRHASFKALREDKPAREVVRESPSVRSAGEGANRA